MRIGDFLYFAPKIKFSELDLSGIRLPEQYQSRIEGFYLNPARELAKSEYAFASGLLVVCAIDALAKIQNGRVGNRFQKWVAEELKSFKDNEIAKRFYDDFRNGLVHEARIKNGGEFSLEQNTTVQVKCSIMKINPFRLCEEVNTALSRFIKLLHDDDNTRSSFIGILNREFKNELAGLTINV
jgi:hypothetical protein